MIAVNRVCAIIPARGGSKGIPRKNIKNLAGKPLINYSIEAALQCSYVNRTIVSTEDSEIKKISQNLGAEVIDRPKELASDIALTRDVVLHVLETLEKRGDLPDFFVLLQPTSPLRNSQHLQNCLKLFFESNGNCVISVTEEEHHPYKDFKLVSGHLSPLFDQVYLDKPRQLMDVIYRQNGAIYALKTRTFLEEKSFFVKPAFPFMMDRESSIDVDNEIDFSIAEMILYRKIR